MKMRDLCVISIEYLLSILLLNNCPYNWQNLILFVINEYDSQFQTLFNHRYAALWIALVVFVFRSLKNLNAKNVHEHKNNPDLCRSEIRKILHVHYSDIQIKFI